MTRFETEAKCNSEMIAYWFASPKAILSEYFHFIQIQTFSEYNEGSGWTEKLALESASSDGH